MTERPILFSAPMVRALLNGTKTQTRRAVKSIALARGEARGVRVAPNAFCYLDFDGVPGLSWRPFGGSPTVPYPPEKVVAACPYGAPGDRLWVRETWRTERRFDSVAPKAVPPRSLIQHAEEEPEPNHGVYGKTRPSIFMLRWASRITLEVTRIRVERLQAITEADAIAEGVDLKSEAWPDTPGAIPISLKPTFAYELLWKSINGADSWKSNPWVWVVEFRRVMP